MENNISRSDNSFSKYGSGTERERLISNGNRNFISELADLSKRSFEKRFPSGFCYEFVKLFHLTWPISITVLAEGLIGPISLMFCGHLKDEVMLDSAGLAISIIKISVIAVAIGMGTACNTFFSQYYGSEMKQNMGYTVQKALIIFLLASMIVVSLNLNMGYILFKTGQDPEISRLTGEYLNIFIPGAISYFVYTVLRQYLHSQNVVIPNMIICISANIVNCILHYIFLYRFLWNIQGSAYSLSISYTCLSVFTFLYILFSGIYKETWNGMSWKCLDEWGAFSKLAVFGMISVCVESSALETGVLISGILGKVDLGAQVVLNNIFMTWAHIGFSICTSNSVRVSQYLGCGNIKGAVTVANVSLLSMAVISIIIPSLLFGFKYFVISVFTSDIDIASLSLNVFYLVYCVMFFDGVCFVCKTILYAAGKQVFVGIFSLVSTWCVFLPIAVSLMLKTYFRIAVFWFVLAIVLLLQEVVLLTVIFKMDWEKASEEALERTDEEGDESSEMIPSFKKVVGKRLLTISIFIFILCLSITLHEII